MAFVIALLSYLYSTRTLGILYKRCGSMCLSLYCDSSYGSVPEMNMTSVCVSGLVNRVNRVSRVAVWSAGGARPASVCGAVEPGGRTECKITWHLWR